jgi:hypothetical protein
MNRSKAAFRPLMLAVTAVLSSCGDDAARVVDGAAPGSPSSPDPVTSAPETPDSAVIYAILIREPEGFSEYLIAGDAVPTGTIDRSRGLELRGGNYYPQPDAVYYGNFETKTLQRYQVNPDYSISMTGEFSLANYGIPFLNSEPLFFSPTSAYYLDAERGQIIMFDPSQMSITGDISVPELFREGYSPFLGDPVKVGDRYLGTIMYSADDGTLAEGSTVSFMVEDNPAQPLRLVQDDRAMGAQRAFVDAAGDFYALADAGGGWLGLTGQQVVPSPGLLRVKSGASDTDRDYFFDLGAAMGTPAVNGLWQVDDTTFALQAWAAELQPNDVIKEPGDYDVGSYFDWFLVDAATREVRPIAGLDRAPPSYTLLQFRVDDTTYVQQYRIVNGDYDQAHVELYAIAPDATARKVADTTRGDLRLLARVSTRR